MKRKYIIILLLLINSNIYSLDFNFAKVFLNHYNGVLTNNENTSYYFTADLVNFNIMNTDTNIGIFLSPLQYSFIFYPQTQLLSFVNLKIYYNFYNIRSNYYDEVENIIGPFFSINWMNLKNFNEFDFNNIVYSTGLLISTRIFAGGSTYDIKKFSRQTDIINYFTLELGYKNINGKDNFYVGVQISDPIMVFATILYFTYALFGIYP
ncbi:MAG: hypothetical protein LBI28_14100 [Treponema sp.]|jgi:hypothetical protein|nr:hypothetical protein [Treponema sp.]